MKTCQVSSPKMFSDYALVSELLSVPNLTRRVDAGLFWQVCQTDDYEYLVLDQANVHALALGRALEACLMCDVPYTLLLFPRLVRDARYCYHKVAEGLPISWVTFKRAWQDLARPGEVRQWT